MKKKTILIVDDTFENLYLLRVILEEAGFNVIEAGDGSEGLKKLHENSNVDLIISDILMPVMDGYLFCQACKEEKLFKNIPFVFYTSAYTEKLDEEFGLKLGAASFLKKPIDHDELLLAVNTVFDTIKAPVKQVEKSRISEDEVLKLYSERLINQLEQKSVDLGNEVLERKKAEQLLIHKNEILDLIAVNTPLNKILERLLLNYEFVHPDYFGSISLLDQDGLHLNLMSAPSIPKPYNLALKRFAIGENVGSCGTAAFTKKPVIVSDISKDKLWINYKDIALKHNLKSCWSLPILSKKNTVLGTFAIYSKAINTPSLEEIRELNFAVSLANIAIEKVRIVAEIKKKDESYKSLIDQANDAIITYSLDGTIHDYNKASYISLGYTKKEFLKIKLQDFNIGALIQNLDNHKKLLKGKAILIERQFKCKDKSIIDVEISAKLQKDGKILSIARNITERKEAEKALENNAKKSFERKNVIIELASLVGTNYKEALNKITALSAKTLNIERVSVLKFNKEKTEVFCERLYTQKSNDYVSGLVLYKKGNENYFNTLNQNKIINASDALSNELTKGFVKDYLVPLNIKSKLSIPIHSENGVYGILCFEQVDTKHDWNPDEERFATSIANLVSLMIESTERKIAESEAISANKQLLIANKELVVLRNQLEQENVYLRNELDLVFNYEEMVYGSEAFSNVLTEVEKVAPTTATVLLLGESGTGKELLARAVHNTSLRNKKPLIKVNCSAIPRELMESELFGHKKGSFTGAISDKVGKFELADGGTLFLDEIGEMPLDMQPKILRFLQEGEIEVVGGTTGFKKLDVRVIAATNKNLKKEVKKKQFREDLFFRLNVFPIAVPPLRKRKEDIPLLVEHFVDKFNKAYGKNIQLISDEAMSKLIAYEWPGNIRELENLIERASILSNNDTLVIPGFESSNQKINSINNRDLSLDAVQRNHILQVLEQCNWKISGTNGAAELLKLKPSTLRDRMQKLDLKKQ